MEVRSSRLSVRHALPPILLELELIACVASVSPKSGGGIVWLASEMIDAYLLQRPHEEIVVDFTGTAAADFSIATLAGLNWLTHCAQLSGVPPAQQSGTMRNFRKVVTLAQRWWLTEGAADRCAQLLANGEQPPLMLYLIWSEYTRLAKQIAAAAIFGSSISRSTKLVALPAGLISRFEAAQDPDELLGT
jgi:hypothetical protein